MADRYLKPYLDSSVYIAAIKDEQGRANIARSILEDARKGVLQIVASTLVAAEVIRRPRRDRLTEEEEATIDGFLQHDYVTWVELDLSLALEARRLCRTYELKPGDAIHLASAIRGGADVLLRWDGRWQAGEYDGMTVTEPYWEGTPSLFADEQA